MSGTSHALTHMHEYPAMRVGQEVIVHERPDSGTRHDCFLYGPIVEIRSAGLFVVEPTHFRPIPGGWRPYDGVKRILARKLDPETGTHCLTFVGNDSTNRPPKEAQCQNEKEPSK
jgi:hypothetical protein